MPDAPPVPYLACMFCGHRPLLYVPSGPSGLRMRCGHCRVVVVIPRAQLRSLPGRLPRAMQRRLGWAEPLC